VLDREDFVFVPVEDGRRVGHDVGVSPTIYYRWSKDFLEAGKNGLVRDTRRSATTDEVRGLKAENEALKRALAEAVLDVARLKKSLGL